MREIVRMLRQTGALLPRTAEDVRLTEWLFKDPVDLPDSLMDPERVFKGKMPTEKEQP